MHRGVLTPLLSILGAFVVATSAPGLAVAHGAAHLHAAEHELEHAREHAPDGEQSAAPEHLTSATIEETGHGAHQHLQADAAITSRGSATQVVVAAVIALALGTDIPVAAAAPRAEPSDVPDGPPPDRATQPRAPPLG
jgi:hypothetical protein